MFRTIALMAAAIVTAAATASAAPGQPRPVDPLAVSVLKAHGWSATRVYDWTQGTCAYQVKPASCYLTPAEARLASQWLATSLGAPRLGGPLTRPESRPVDPIAVSILKGLGFSASRIYAWTQGACSHQVKPASCYPATPEAKFTSRSGGFDWGDGLIGSGVTAGILLVGALGAFTLYRRRELAHR